MIQFKKIGFMQGRLSPNEKNKIQFFPEKNWKGEFLLANKIGLKNMEWTLDYKNLFKNPIFTEKGKKKSGNSQKNIISESKLLRATALCKNPFGKIKIRKDIFKI